MNFEINQFNSMLDSFNYMCGSFAGNMVSNLEKMQKAYNQAVCLFAEQEKALQTQLASQNSLQKQKDAALSQFEKTNEDLDLKIQTFESQISQLKSEVASLQQQIQQLNTSTTLHQAQISQTKQAQINPLLIKKHSMYEKMLRLRIEPSFASIKLVFTGISKYKPEKEFWAEFGTGDTVTVIGISNELVGVEQFVDECQLTGNFGLLVRRVRRGFSQQYGQTK
ncbi:Conserved_hypothetical protein [Hexamita inflata]|uniref:Kinetochore protein SPC25 n=1 Tax=Hexamita inflata TaxID=28002 RepID=A0AA86QGH3_9EUKA|nr:Conserved hypothetical protein [Hexamita inflata]